MLRVRPRAAWAGALLWAAALASPGAAGVLQAKRFDPAQDVSLDPRLGAPLPLELVFADESGRERTLASFFEPRRPVVLALVYYECPMLCTLVLDGLVRSLRAVPLEVGRDFEVVVASIDPEESSALAAAKERTCLQAYGRGSSAEGWHFLTGSEASIRALARSVGFRYVLDEESGEYAHASGFLVVSPRGIVSHAFWGVDYPARDLRLALVETSRGRIGTLADRVLLLCYHWDPATGRYGLAILSAIRAAGIATAGAIAVFVVRSLRRERRARAGAAAGLPGA